MIFLVGILLVYLFFAFKLYKISYYYNFKYIGNVLRFTTFYIFLSFLINNLLFYFICQDFEINLMITFFILLFLNLFGYFQFKKYLISRFGKEERFENPNDIDEIGNMKNE